MGGWMDRRIENGWINGWMNGKQMDEQRMDVWTDRLMEQRKMDGPMDGRIWTNGWMDGRTENGYVDGWMEKQSPSAAFILNTEPATEVLRPYTFWTKQQTKLFKPQT